VKFTNEQRDKIYNALKTYGQAKAIEKQLDDSVKDILSDEQYTRYKTYSEED